MHIGLNLKSYGSLCVRYSAYFPLFSVIDAFKWFWMASLHKISRYVGLSPVSILDLAFFISIDSHAWNVVAMLGLVLPTATWICYISYRNGYPGLLVLLPLLNPWLIVRM